MSFVIDNSTGTRAITVESGEVIHQTRCCNGLAAFTIPAGEARLFDTSSNQAYAWIEFFNPFLDLPWVSAAVNGMADANQRCCKPGGSAMFDERTMEEGSSLGFALDVQEFLIHRNDDKPNFTFFNLQVG